MANLARSQQVEPPQNFADVSDAAARARDAGHTADAIRLYKQGVHLKQDWAEGWWYLGTLQYDADQFAAAIPAFQALTRLLPQAAGPRNFLGLCEFETGAYDAAKADLERGLSAKQDLEDETRRPATYHLALLLNRTGQFQQSAALLANEFSNGPFPDDAKFALGMALLRVGLLPREVDPSKDALIAKVGEAGALLVQGRKDAAVLAYGDLEKQSLDLPFFHFAYAQALGAAGDRVGALAQYQKELRFYPGHAEAKAEIAKWNDGAAGVVNETDPAHGPDPNIARLYARPDTTSGSPHSSANAAAKTDATFEKWKRDAATYQASGQLDEAVTALQQAIRLRPDWDEGLWNLALLEFARGRIEESLQALKAWTGRNPNSGTAWAMTALCEFSLRDYDNSLIHFQRAESYGFGGSPESVRIALYRYSLLQTRAGHFAKALQLLSDRRLNSNSDAELQFAVGLAALHMPQFPEEVKPEDSQVLQKVGEAVALLNASKYDDGIPKLKTLIAKYPRRPMLRFLYGKALAALSDFDEAATQYSIETQLSPSDPIPLVDLALVLLQGHRAQEALAPARRATELSPDSAEAHYALGRAYLDLRQDESAESELTAAARLAPSSPEVHFNLAKAYARRNQPEKAAAERAIFTRLTEVAEKQRAGNRNQTYGESRGESALSWAPESQSNSAPPN